MIGLGTMPKPFSFVPEGRWSAEEAREVLVAAERSGLSVQRFAAQQGLVAGRLYHWKRKLGELESMRFVEGATPTMQSCVEVVLPAGVVLRVPESASIEFVRRLVAALARERVC